MWQEGYWKQYCICQNRNLPQARETLNKKILRKKMTLKKIIIFDITIMLATILFYLLYKIYQYAWMQPLYITGMVTSYQFGMRLLVAELIMLKYRNREFPLDSVWFRLYAFEPELYRILRVKKWKDKLITARPEQFDLKKRTPKEILHNIVQAEVGHRIIMPLSFVPIVLIVPYGAAGVFIITSILSCLIEVPFIIIQRYNRPRVIKWIKLKEKE